MSDFAKDINVPTNDCISRQAAIELKSEFLNPNVNRETEEQTAIDRAYARGWNSCNTYWIDEISELPSAQPERDIPLKPIETADRAWGIPSRQAVCPKCDYYLGHVAFLGDYKGKRVTYCETCGQAIDWEGWNFDE